MAFVPPVGAGEQPQPPKNLKEVQALVDKLYGDRDAKHVGEGLVKGAVSVTKGVFAGVGTLVAAPLVGLAKGGIQGLVGGTVAGAVGAVTLPIIGVVQGAQQVGVGLMNTPEAVRDLLKKDKAEEEAEKADLLDDPEAEQANERAYSLTRETVEGVALEGEGGTDSAASKAQEPPPAGDAAPPPSAAGEPRPVKDKSLYLVLGVETDATSAQIKKAYYRLAKEYHPDKNGGDETAKQRFQELAEAYQTLMDEEKRAAYDKYGKDGVQEGFMDPSAFFTMSFGAEKFEPLVGTLTVAFTAGQQLSVAQLQAFQRRREQTLAAILIARLEPWVAGYEEKFVEEALAEAVVLRKEPFGDRFLQCIGYTYYSRAQVCLGLQQALGIPGFLKSVQGSGHAMKTRYQAVDAALRLAEVQQSVQRGQLTPEAAMPQFLDAVWLISVLDIESTLSHVVDAVVKDSSLPKETRKRRATGIMRLGRIFYSA